MRLIAVFGAVFGLLAFMVSASRAQNAAVSGPGDAKFVTVPAALDQNRVIIDVDLPLPSGSTERVRAWVDTGNPELWMTQRIATLMGLALTCDGQNCHARAPREVLVGGMKISLAGAIEARVPLRDDLLFPGMSAEINLPSTVLRNYDMIVSFPGHEFSIGAPGTLHFKGVSGKVIVNPENGLVQVPGKIDRKNYNLGLDLGAPVSLLPADLFDKLAADHPQWPRMTGAVSAANMWGSQEELQAKLLRLDRLQYGPLFFTGIAVAEFPSAGNADLMRRARAATAGVIGANALLNYRVGIDYAHKIAYFDIGLTFRAPEFDVVGLTLRPEADGRFTVIAVVPYEGKSSEPELQPGDILLAVDNIPVNNSTLGRVWSMLKGLPGQERKLTLERAGKQIIVSARVQHFIGDVLDGKDSGK